MEIKYKIEYHHLVIKGDIPHLNKTDRNRIQKAIEEKLFHYPEVFGIPLRKSLKGYRKLRVGDYRVVFKIESKIIRILIIEHRSVVYEEIYKRIK